MFKRLSLLLAISLHMLTWGITSDVSLSAAPKAYFSVADFFKPFRPSTYKISSSSVLQALGKFLPVNYQKGVNSALSGCPYHIGDFAQGGVIIFLTHDGQHGLVAAIEDAKMGAQTTFTWGPITSPYDNPQAYNNDPLPYSTPTAPYRQYYSGYKNQNIGMIQNNLSNFPAFEAAHNYQGGGYADWWLPCSTELSLMYAMKGIINQVSLENKGDAMLNDPNNASYSYYWSSRELEYDSSNAWNLGFFYGDQGSSFKGNPYAVRCVRAF